MADSLLNKSNCRKFVIRWATANRRGWLPKRVAKSYLEEAEAAFRLSLQKSIAMHPTIGKTVKDYL